MGGAAARAPGPHEDTAREQGRDVVAPPAPGCEAMDAGGVRSRVLRSTPPAPSFCQQEPEVPWAADPGPRAGWRLFSRPVCAHLARGRAEEFVLDLPSGASFTSQTSGEGMCDSALRVQVATPGTNQLSRWAEDTEDSCQGHAPPLARRHRLRGPPCPHNPQPGLPGQG